MSEQNRVTINIFIKNRIETVKNTFNELIFFVAEDVKFKNATNGKFVKYKENKFQSLLDIELSEDEFDYIYMSGKETMNCFKNFQSEEVIVITLTLFEDTFLFNEKKIMSTINDIMQTVGIVANINSLEDVFWQNNMNVDMYKYLKREIKGVPLFDSKRFVGEKEVDVEKLPGYEKQIGNIWFGSAWQMWFNTPYYEYVSKESIKNFSECFLNEKLSEDCFHIQLYENLNDYEENDNRERQWALKKAIGFDDVVKVATEKNAKREYNPSIEIKTGLFNHGGVRQIYTYLNNEMQSVTKSTAAKVEVIEYDSKGNVLWKDILDWKN